MRWGLLFAVGAAFLAVPHADASNIVFDFLNASLTTGSLAGNRFTVNFSYDADQVTPVGDSYIFLSSFDFTLLGVPFTKTEIFQGGQVLLRNGVIYDVTASYQVRLPPNAPVKNITFGFGAPGIGYIDLNGNFGSGTFTIGSTSVPEPATGVVLALPLLLLVGCISRRSKRIAEDTPTYR